MDIRIILHSMSRIKSIVEVEGIRKYESFMFTGTAQLN